MWKSKIKRDHNIRIFFSILMPFKERFIWNLAFASDLKHHLKLEYWNLENIKFIQIKMVKSALNQETREQTAFTYSKLTIEILEQDVKYVQS